MLRVLTLKCPEDELLGCYGESLVLLSNCSTLEVKIG